MSNNTNYIAIIKVFISVEKGILFW